MVDNNNHHHPAPAPACSKCYRQETPAYAVNSCLRWPGFMSRKTLAVYLEIAPNTLDDLVSNGLLPQPTFAPRARLKRWSKAAIDETLTEEDRPTFIGQSMSDALADLSANEVH